MWWFYQCFKVTWWRLGDTQPGSFKVYVPLAENQKITSAKLKSKCLKRNW